MVVDVEVVSMRAKWDQVEAMVTEAELRGEPLPGARYGLAVAKEMLDHAERLGAIRHEHDE